jgi:hypothetical protein
LIYLEAAVADSEVTPKRTPTGVGAGLLGFSERPLAHGVFAYYKVLGLSQDEVKQVVDELREGMSPLTRAPKQF